MLTKDKRNPAFTDLDKMPFGRYKGELLQDVPASYFRWLWQEIKEFSSQVGDNPSIPFSFKEKTMLANYIWNSKSAIEQELGETL